MSESQSQNEDRDLKDFLSPLHEEALKRGKLLARHLDESVRARLDTSKGIDELRRNIRHAPSLANSTAADIRCVVAITAFAAALDGLVFEKESGDSPYVMLSNGVSIHVGDKHVETDYFVERILSVISCEMQRFDQQTVDDLFYTLLTLLDKQILSIRDYIITETENGVRLVHKDGVDHSQAV